MEIVQMTFGLTRFFFTLLALTAFLCGTSSFADQTKEAATPGDLTLDKTDGKAPVAAPPAASQSTWKTVPKADRHCNKLGEAPNTSLSTKHFEVTESNIASDRPTTSEVTLPISVERFDISDDSAGWTIHKSEPVTGHRKTGDKTRSIKMSNVNMQLVPPLPIVRIHDSKNPFSGVGIDLSMPVMRNFVH
jgi:hypothetical protein